jgi:hypothetical protein
MDVEDFFRFLFKLTVSGNKLKKDIDQLRNQIQDYKSKLVTFTHHEMELLSLNQSNKVSSKGFNKTVKGIFDTIYYENLVAYIIKKYPNGQSLTLITTSQDEFVYLNKGKVTHIYLNNVEAGILNTNGDFIGMNNKKLAFVDGADHLPTHAVWIGQNNVGFISNPRYKDKTIPRAFSLLKEMSKDEQLIFLCLTLINLVEESQ